MTYSPQHLDRLRLRHLRLLELIERHGSLRAVGAELSLTQPAVSQMVKDLEYAFGATLIDRSVRGVSLSASGKLALQRVRASLAAFDQLAEELDADRTLTLRVGTNPAMMYSIMPAALRRLDAGRSGGNFCFQTGPVSEMLQSLLDGEVDCYVGRIDWDQVTTDTAAMLWSEPIMETDLVLACPRDHALAGRRGLRVQDIVDHPWALPRRHANNRIVLEAGLRNCGCFGLKSVIEVAADLTALMNVADQLNLLTCVPRLALEGHSASAALQVLDLPELRLAPIHIGVAALKGGEKMPVMQGFRQALRQSVDAFLEASDRTAPSGADAQR